MSDQTARRRLEDFRAAINAYHAEHTLSVVPKITLPPKAEGRHRWLTRNEAARLLSAVIGYVWDNERGAWKRKEDGTLLRRERRLIRRRYPAARFCLIGICSARREETIRRTQWLPTTTHPWVNWTPWSTRARAPLSGQPKATPSGKDRCALASPHGSLVQDRSQAIGRAARGRHHERRRVDPVCCQPHERRSASCR